MKSIFYARELFSAFRKYPSRSMGVIVPTQNLKGHGLQEQVGLLSCLHPITRGEYVNGPIHDAATRYYDIANEANHAVDKHKILLTGDIRRLSPFHRAALTFTHEGLERHNSDAQFCLGVMHWKGVGVRCDLDQAVFLYLMAAEQVKYFCIRMRSNTGT